ncbi:hypothetical protein AARAC_008755 [Aspergillus arachidicola]|uniref:Uncharacterized protein n=1 Tax=Aspergillus arachidicola TaxID=656916 RepID=A0A2G7EPH4_9EURO|nr:hypothetical protein AARAC_008755 [Aspergillus arachidicola]
MSSGVISTLVAIQPSQFTAPADRFAAKEAVRRLLARLETPFEQGWAITFEGPGLAHTTCEPNLLRRFLRHIAALYVIQETGVGTWHPTPTSLALGAQETHAGEVIKAGYVCKASNTNA